MVVLKHTGGIEGGQGSVVLLHKVVVVASVVQVMAEAGDEQANSLGGEGRGWKGGEGGEGKVG